MELRRTIIAGAFSKSGFGSVGPREIEGIFSEGKIDRMGDIVEPDGCRMHEITNGLVVLAQHDSTMPIARATSVWRGNGRITGRIQFPPEGTSEKSDEYCRLVKSGVIDSLSIGFSPHEYKPIGNTGGLRFTDWSLLEVSFVSVPALPSAVVTAKRGPESGMPFAEQARATIARIKSSPAYCAYKRQQAAEVDAERQRAEWARSRAETHALCAAARRDYDRIFRR